MNRLIAKLSSASPRTFTGDQIQAKQPKVLFTSDILTANEYNETPAIQYLSMDCVQRRNLYTLVLKNEWGPLCGRPGNLCGGDIVASLTERLKDVLSDDGEFRHEALVLLLYYLVFSGDAATFKRTIETTRKLTEPLERVSYICSTMIPDSCCESTFAFFSLAKHAMERGHPSNLSATYTISLIDAHVANAILQVGYRIDPSWLFVFLSQRRASSASVWRVLSKSLIFMGSTINQAPGARAISDSLLVILKQFLPHEIPPAVSCPKGAMFLGPIGLNVLEQTKTRKPLLGSVASPAARRIAVNDVANDEAAWLWPHNLADNILAFMGNATITPPISPPTLEEWALGWASIWGSIGLEFVIKHALLPFIVWYMEHRLTNWLKSSRSVLGKAMLILGRILAKGIIAMQVVNDWDSVTAFKEMVDFTRELCLNTILPELSHLGIFFLDIAKFVLAGTMYILPAALPTLDVRTAVSAITLVVAGFAWNHMEYLENKVGSLKMERNRRQYWRAYCTLIESDDDDAALGKLLDKETTATKSSESITVRVQRCRSQIGELIESINRNPFRGPYDLYLRYCLSFLTNGETLLRAVETEALNATDFQLNLHKIYFAYFAEVTAGLANFSEEALTTWKEGASEVLYKLLPGICSNLLKSVTTGNPSSSYQTPQVYYNDDKLMLYAPNGRVFEAEIKALNHAQTFISEGRVTSIRVPWTCSVELIRDLFSDEAHRQKIIKLELYGAGLDVAGFSLLRNFPNAYALVLKYYNSETATRIVEDFRKSRAKDIQPLEITFVNSCAELVIGGKDGMFSFPTSYPSSVIPHTAQLEINIDPAIFIDLVTPGRESALKTDWDPGELAQSEHYLVHLIGPKANIGTLVIRSRASRTEPVRYASIKKRVVISPPQTAPWPKTLSVYSLVNWADPLQPNQQCIITPGFYTEVECPKKDNPPDTRKRKTEAHESDQEVSDDETGQSAKKVKHESPLSAPRDWLETVNSVLSDTVWTVAGALTTVYLHPIRLPTVVAYALFQRYGPR